MILREFAAIRLHAGGARGKEGSFRVRKIPEIPCFGPDEPGPILTITPATPLFFVSVESKRLRFPVSPLSPTLTREFASVDSKRLTDATRLPESSGTGHEDFKELEVRSDTPAEQTKYSISALIVKWLLLSPLDASG